MVDRVLQLDPSRPLLRDNGTMDLAFQLFTLKLADRALIIGNGSPEGVIEASQGALYMDEDAAAGDILYIKRQADISGDKTQGWRAV